MTWLSPGIFAKGPQSEGALDLDSLVEGMEALEVQLTSAIGLLAADDFDGLRRTSEEITATAIAWCQAGMQVPGVAGAVTASRGRRSAIHSRLTAALARRFRHALYRRRCLRAGQADFYSPSDFSPPQD